jgi:hypothetical protein
MVFVNAGLLVVLPSKPAALAPIKEVLVVPHLLDGKQTHQTGFMIDWESSSYFSKWESAQGSSSVWICSNPLNEKVN